MQKKLLFLAYLFIWCKVSGQHYSFARFTIENGLSNNVVYSTLQDSKGFLWVATHDGLNRYDGFEFKKFLHSPFDKKSLAGNMTIDIAEDDQNRLWILTNTHLHLYHESDGSFERFILPAGAINHSNQSASRIINGDKRFLLMNLFNGLFVFDKQDRRFTPVTVNSETNEKADLFNFPFFKDNDGNILIAGGLTKGVFKFDSATISLIRQLPANYRQVPWQNENVTSIFKTRKNELIYCTQDGNKFSLVTVNGKKHFLLDRSIAGITVFIEAISEDEQGDIWIGYGNRVFEYLPASDTVIDLSENLYTTSIGNNFIIKTIYIDNFSNLWLGLYEAGLLKASIRKSLFFNFSINQRGNLKLPHSSIFGLIRNPDETVIVRYFGTQLASAIDVANRRILKNEFKFNPLDNDQMAELFGQFKPLLPSHSFEGLFDATTRLTFNNGQFGLYKDKQQDLWTVNFNEFRRIRDGLKYNLVDHVNCFYEGDNNTFWIGTDGRGLVELDHSTGQEKTFLPHESDPASISSQYINGIVPESKKGLWLATRYGLNYFDFHSRQFKLFSVENGLCNNSIYTIEKDNDGKLWLGTGNGLSCFDPHTNEFTNFSKNNGLVNSEYNRNGTIALSNGWILMGGTEGIDVIIPDSIKYRRLREKRSPPLVITLFTTPDSSFYSFAEPIRLTHQQNNVVISFAALDFTQPHNNKYLWKLEPVDKKWIYALGKHEVNYAGLPPGHYTFKIKAAGADGMWNEKETSFSFAITAPWWQSGWAIAGLIFIGIGILAGILRLYYHRKFRKQLEKQKVLLEKQQAVEKERTRIATDIHDDLGSGLSRIRYLGEMVKLKSVQQENISGDIEKISLFSDEMVDKMNEIVWALNEKNDSLESIISYIRLFAVEYLSNNNLNCKVNLPAEISTVIVKGETRRNIFLSVKECLHNIVKHAGATEVDINISANHELVIRIHDNGKGINWEGVRPFSNGITNIKKRMKETGGQVDFRNEDGTTVVLSIPL
ncbi:MAG: two-component regulator propeller domain-containing protein [Chitinophagales bacterium]